MIFFSRHRKTFNSCSRFSTAPVGVWFKNSLSASGRASKKTALYAPSFSAFLFPLGAPPPLFPFAFFFFLLFVFPGCPPRFLGTSFSQPSFTFHRRKLS